MQSSTAPRDPTRALSAGGLIERAASANTRRTYATALRQLTAWLDGRPLDDRSLAAYVGHLHQTGRAPATAAMAIAAVKRTARNAPRATRRAAQPARPSRASSTPRQPTPPHAAARPGA